jgi:hypothetical protein
MIVNDIKGRARRSEAVDRRANGPALKPYTKPDVVMLGNLAALTKTTGGTAGNNDMGGGKDKTGF